MALYKYIKWHLRIIISNVTKICNKNVDYINFYKNINFIGSPLHFLTLILGYIFLILKSTITWESKPFIGSVSKVVHVIIIPSGYVLGLDSIYISNSTLTQRPEINYRFLSYYVRSAINQGYLVRHTFAKINKDYSTCTNYACVWETRYSADIWMINICELDVKNNNASIAF